MSDRCEQFAAALATGGPIRRWRALRHAARCPRCAAARDDLRRIAEALAGLPPLTAAQRRLWVQAAGDEITTSRPRAWSFRPALAGGLAIAVATVIGFGVWRALHPASRRHALPAVTDVQPPARPSRDEEGLRGRAVAQELDDLRARVVALGRELDELRGLAELLDARKEADTLMARLAPRGGSNGL